jgi:signal transduction histidine kinase
VTDDGRPGVDSAGGHGLIGMRERVGIFGGTFSAGPSESGGFAVRALLPLESTA